MVGASALEQLLCRIAHAESGAAAGFTCAPEGAAWRLGIWGSLAPTWAGNVSLHCYAASVGIVSGEALRLRDRRWAGSFVLEIKRGNANPSGFDFLQMARRQPLLVPSLAPPEIDGLAVERDPGERSAMLRISGRDQLGFLAHTLGKIAACELEPQRISLQTTREGLVSDEFLLLGTGGAPVSETSLSRLVRSLRES